MPLAADAGVPALLAFSKLLHVTSAVAGFSFFMLPVVLLTSLLLPTSLSY
jgi:hypothetical protein